MNKISLFIDLSEKILRDILEALKDQNCSYEQVHALLPLLSDIRKHGDNIMAQRKFYHSVLFPDSELKLIKKIHRLRNVEKFIKTLSKEERVLRKNHLSKAFKKRGIYES